MKKILYTLFLFCIMGIAIADVDFTQAIQSTKMPTDAEIRAVISQFNFNDEQADALFKETKSRLQQMYASENINKTNAELNQYLNQLNSESVTPYMDNSLKQELLQSVSNMPSQKSNVLTKTQNSSNSVNTRKIDKEAFRSKSYRAQKGAR